MLDHNYNSESRTATCTQDGYERTVCSRCGDVSTNITKTRLGHNNETMIVAATCTANGYEIIKCIRCGAIENENIYQKLGHDYGTWNETLPNCTNAGIREHTCSRCGNVENEILTALGHDYSYDSGINKKVCSRCRDEVDIEPIQVNIPIKVELLNKTLQANEFTIEFSQGGYFASMWHSSNDSFGNVDSGITQYTSPGTYRIGASQQIPASTNGINYDTSFYGITIEVTADINGDLSSYISIERNGSAVSEIIFVNEYIIGNVQLSNVDFDDTTVSLTGAEFSLYRDDDTRIYASGSSGSYTYSESSTNGKFVTDSDGKINITGLPYGTYYFIETKAPDEYEENTSHIEFSIESSNDEKNVRITNKKILNIETTLMQGNSVNLLLKQLVDNSITNYETTDSTITAIRKSTTEPTSGTEKVNIALSGKEPVYAWLNGTTVYWYTRASKVNMNADSSFIFFSLSAVTDLSDCTKEWDTSNVTTMSSMFDECLALTDVDVSGFVTSKVTNMSFMFNKCTALTSLNLTSFDTSNVTTMRAMFQSCKFSSLNLSDFDTEKVTNMRYMFYNCTNLLDVFVSEKLVTDSVTESTNMFGNCKSIKGGNNTSYNSSYVDKTYARIDKPGTPGYFTSKGYAHDHNFVEMYEYLDGREWHNIYTGCSICGKAYLVNGILDMRTQDCVYTDGTTTYNYCIYCQKP